MLYSGFAISVNHDLDAIKGELRTHLLLIDKISFFIHEDYESQLTKLENRLSKSNSDEECDMLRNSIHDSHERMETFTQVYLNAIFINSYALFENTLAMFCKEYLKLNLPKIHGRYIKSYWNHICRRLKSVPSSLNAEVNAIEESYRDIRNVLVHGKYDTRKNIEAKIKNFTDIEVIPFVFNGYGRAGIQDKDFVSGFIFRIEEVIVSLFQLLIDDYLKKA